MLLHIQSFQPNRQPLPQTLWLRLTPQTRLICILSAVFASALTPNGEWGAWLVYGIATLVLTILSRVPLPTLLSRVAIEFAFVAVVLLGTLFGSQGSVVWSWGWLRVTTGGLIVLGSVTSKVLISLFLVNILILTTPATHILQALLVLRFPPILVAIMASMYRYINLLASEFLTMRRAAMSRNLMLSPQSARLAIGHAIGSLFIRTLDRGERIYQAMLARGYTETMPYAKLPAWGRADAIALGIVAFVVAIGQFSR